MQRPSSSFLVTSFALLVAAGCAAPSPASQCAGETGLTLAASGPSTTTATDAPPNASSAPGKPRRVGISNASKRLVCSLRDELIVEAHFSKGYVEPRFVAEVKTLLDAYADPGCDTKIRTRIIEIDDAEEERIAEKAGLTRRREAYAPVDAKIEIDMRKGFSGFVFRYGTETGALPFWPPKDTVTLEYFVTSEIRGIVAHAENAPIVIGCVVAKGTTCLSDPMAGGPGASMTLRNLIAEYSPYFELRDLELTEEIPNELVGVVVTQPRAALGESELRRLDAFLMRGGKTLLASVSPVEVPAHQRAMNATLGAHGLEPLLEAYGVTQRRAVLWDVEGALSFRTVGNDGKPYALVHAPTPVVADDRLDTTFAPFTSIIGVPFPFAAPLDVHREKQPEATFRVVARSTKGAHVSKQKSFELAEFGARDGKGEGTEQALAVVVEGKLKSAFSASKSRAPSRLFVLSSSLFFGNPFDHAGSPEPMPPQLQMMGGVTGDEELLAVGRVYTSRYFVRNFSVLRNTFDWMAGESDYAELTADVLERDRALAQ